MEQQNYTEAETARIAEWVALGLTYTEIAANLPGRTTAGIWHKVKGMGLKARRKERASDRNKRDYLRRIERENERLPDNTNEVQDEAFRAAMKKAIEAGLEFAEEGVSLVPCTDNPKIVRPYAIQFSRSPALMCFEHGDRRNGAFA